MSQTSDMDALTKRTVAKKKAQRKSQIGGQALAQSRSMPPGAPTREKRDKLFQKTYELDSSATFFPLRDWRFALEGARNENYLHTIRLAFDQAVLTDGAGTINSVISNSPVQAQNWTNYAAVFDEYRVLAFKVTFEPYWASSVVFAPLAAVIDRSDSTALTSYGLAERYASHKKVQGKKPLSRVAGMSTVDESNFTITSAPGSNTWIKFYSALNTASITIGRLNCEMLVQFRGVGIN